MLGLNLAISGVFVVDVFSITHPTNYLEVNLSLILFLSFSADQRVLWGSDCY